MANGAGRIFNVFKNTAENTTNIGNQYVILEVVSTNPLQFKLGDKLIITEEFIVLSSLVDINLLTIGSKVQALVFNNNQLFYILNNRSFTQVIDNLTSEATDKALSAKQGKVLKGLIDNTYTSSEIDTFLSTINGNISSLNDTKLNKTVVTDAYSSSSTYAVGDYCIYENTLYKCTTAITTAENWNSAHWTGVNISYEFKRITNELSNKLNSNKVIQENGTVSTSNVYSSKAVENLMKVSFCKMTTNFESKTITDYTKVEGFKNAVNYGDYIADITNSRLIIKNTKLLQLTGLYCGIGNNRCAYEIYDNNNNRIFSDVGKNVLYQFGGNGYFQAPLPALTIELNPAKTYYIYLYAVAYNSNAFYLNAGFGADGTWISATKIA